ncbi:DNA/RNA non-specific endonuclease [Collinsella sp. An2]|uniref:DNA/RNA non-specific endonuclease n=1 Tax=Collinsella sp. An2 TaxID=1965585 RepID=UPI000B3805F0|nr:DNA/RNA non-specific endonuclease [Collinsella sp. An2]OUP09812.1 hypothetical protein B5F33_04290 [Collinsella sp. An2]
MRQLRKRISLVAALAAALILAGCSQLTSVVDQVTGGLVQHEYPAEVSEALAVQGDAVQDVGDGSPSFTDEEIAYAWEHLDYESYSPLDALGRCGAATACAGAETMPAPGEERESISDIHPSGWHSVSYDCVEGGSLYNRTHLIAWMLAAENANERNLVTGTRFMNAQLMLPFEEEVARYIDDTGNHVLYRVTPVFEGSELVCRAVQIEARSLEDDGAGVSFNVLCRNVQPGIELDYATGDSWEEGTSSWTDSWDEDASHWSDDLDWEELLSAL